jgi:hypothetical protein
VYEIADGKILFDPFRLISAHVRRFSIAVGGAGPVPICFEADGSARLSRPFLNRFTNALISVLLVVIAGVLLFTHGRDIAAVPPFTGWVRIVVGVLAGFIIGVVASLHGVAGGSF